MVSVPRLRRAVLFKGEETQMINVLSLIVGFAVCVYVVDWAKGWGE